MEGQGRARGRARGRSRPPAAQAAPSAPPSVAPSTSAQSSSASSSSGLPMGRSGARSRPVDAPAKDLPRQMQSLSVGGSGNGSNGNGSNGNGNGNGNGDDKPKGRYAVRGGREVADEDEKGERRPRGELITRPASADSKKGISGMTVKIQTNHFKLETKPKWTLYMYHVDFNPAEDRTFIRKILLREHEKSIGKYMFDGSTLFSIQRICVEGVREVFSKRTSDDENIRITIKQVGTLEPGDYQYLQIFNIILRDCSSKLNLQEIRRNYFDQKAAITIREHNLELWPGYITAMGQYEYNVLLQAEIVYKVLRKDTAYDLFRELISSGDGRNYQDAFKMAIIGTVVLTNYNNKTYRIDDVSYEDTPEATFKQKVKGEERHISYRNYFQGKYNVKVNDAKQPMLISRSSARERRSGMPELVYLVPELCIMTGLNDNMRSNYQLMKAVAEHTAVSPSDRVTRLLNFNKRMTSVPEVKKKLDDWGMKLSPNLVEVDGRLLPQETIFAGDGKKFQSGPDVDWTRNLRTSKMLNCASLTRWVILFPGRSQDAAKNLARMLTECGRGMGFAVPNPQPISLPNDNASAYVNGLDRAINEYNPQLVVCVVPNNRADRYSAIKKKCITEKPVPSQVVLLKNILAKSAMSIATKITIQINAKLGGAPWTVEIPAKDIMIVGFDVCHDPKSKSKSFGAMVASMNPNITSYFSTLNHHTTGDELSGNMALNITKAVQRYVQLNKKYPGPIVIYRDGVGEGDLRNVYEVEIKNVREALEPMYKAANVPLRLAVVIVTKRINTRLFNNGRNPAPGTVVDDVITNPKRYDFYLVSQSVRQGTVSPTNYNVIHDTSGLKADHIQRLTYKMTHMYFNWSGTVRVPAPCQYAHKLAFLTAQSVGKAHTNLDQLLYFL